MKTIKVVGLLTTAFFTFSACETGGEELAPAEQLLGTWELNYYSEQEILTANRETKVFDGDSKGEGSIEVSGAHSASLTYIWYFHRDEHDTSVSVSNREWNTWAQPMYYLGLYDSEWHTEITLSVDTESDSYYYYSFEKGGFFFDNLTLTISEMTLYRWDWETETVIDSTDNVTISGTVTAATIDIAANTPTVLQEFTDEDPNETLIFKDGDDFVWISYDEWVRIGVWEVEDDTLTLYGIGKISSFVYTLDDDHLTLKSEDDFCFWAKDDPDDYASCLKYFEGEYGLDKGSLDSIVDHVILELSRSSDRRLARELQTSDGSDGKSIRGQLFRRNRNPGSSRYPHPPKQPSLLKSSTNPNHSIPFVAL